MNKAKKILLVEDDASLGFVMKDNLTAKGYDVTHCADGEEAEQIFLKHHFDVCIVDVMLPKKDGFSLAKTIRSKNENVPILFVTAKTLLEDKLNGFSSGGDDYITKPFSMEELCLRLGVFLRRAKGVVDEKHFILGQYTFDYSNLTLLHPKMRITLTQKEAEILLLFCKQLGQVLKREEILKAVWGTDDYFLGRSLDVFLSKLRKYLKEDNAVQILNYHGVGFRLEIKPAGETLKKE